MTRNPLLIRCTGRKVNPLSFKPVGRTCGRTFQWLGCDEVDAAATRARAVLAGRQYQDIRPGVSARPRTIGTKVPDAA